MASPLHSFDDAKERAVAWLTAWGSQGVHRTGTIGDAAGALWLAREAASLGAEVTTETFELDRLDPVACHLELNGERITAVPAYDAPPTSSAGLTGSLSLNGHDAAILVARLSPQSVYTGEHDRLRRGTSHRALVIICTGERPGMGLLKPSGSDSLIARQRSMCRARRVRPSSPVLHASHPPASLQKADMFRRSRKTS